MTVRPESEAVAARPSGIAHLVVQRSVRGAPRVGERLPLRAVNAIGRDAGNDVVLNDEAASAKHALLEFAEGEWWIEDSGSTNGTLVNGASIKEHILTDGDEIRIGNTVLHFEAS